MNNLLSKKTSELTKKKKKGFTLVELIIVIAIIAILAAIAIPKFGAVREDSNRAADVANAKNISLAVSKAIAEGDVDYNPAVANAALTNVGGANIENEIDGITATTHVRTAGFTDNEYTVSVSLDGNVSVFAGEAGAAGTEIYPNTAAAFQ